MPTKSASFELFLTRDPIQPPPTPPVGVDGKSGAILVFWGVVRGTEGGQPIVALEYSAFETMARHQFQKLFETAVNRWALQSIRLIHRLGPVQAGEPSLWIEVASPHRAEAFASCQWIIDQMKQVVPIWKKVIPGPTASPLSH